MSRRGVLGLTGAVIASMTLTPTVFGRTNAATKPNFIVIMVDDGGWSDWGCFGAPITKTPFIDKMCTEGVKFTDFYMGGATCSASRASLLTGCHPARVGFGTPFYVNEPYGLHPNEITIAELLKGAGYTTALTGKWHAGDRPIFNPTLHGFDYFYGITCGSTLISDGLWINNQNKGPLEPEVTTKAFTDEAITWMNANHEKPFFLWLSYCMPHVPIAPSRQFSGSSQFNMYGDVVQEIDWNVGRVMQTLKDLNIDDNTVVAICSDNGPWLRQLPDAGSSYPFQNGKGAPEEGGQRSPLVMRWPGVIPAGTVCNKTACSMDFYVTFAKLAGATIPNDRVIDGHDIFPLMTSQTGAVSPYDEIGFLYESATFKSVRKGTWKTIDVWGQRRLYDLSNGREVQLSANPQGLPGLSDTLWNLTQQKWTELQANSRPLGDANKLPKSKLLSQQNAKLINAAWDGYYYTLAGKKIRCRENSSLPRGVYFTRDTRGKFLRKIVLQ
ncbi:MAG: sulfatase-like hydrolase/transferase [Fibrobacteres bacterium]|nr:sulfatase-like hydrolase/transferase [Fibrobacterota bacterium]